MLFLLLCTFVLLLKFASFEETRPIYAYVYPSPRKDDYFLHYKTWSKGHGFYISPEPYEECKKVGQVLMDPEDSQCCYLVCDYGPRPRYDMKTGRYELYVRRNRCPLGTRIGESFPLLSKESNYLKKYRRSPCSQHDLTKICSVKYYVRKEMSDDFNGSGDDRTQYIAVGGSSETASPGSTTLKYKEVLF